jgi:hypothetical protein
VLVACALAFLAHAYREVLRQTLDGEVLDDLDDFAAPGLTGG